MVNHVRKYTFEYMGERQLKKDKTEERKQNENNYEPAENKRVEMKKTERNTNRSGRYRTKKKYVIVQTKYARIRLQNIAGKERRMSKNEQDLCIFCLENYCRSFVLFL